MKTTSNSRRVKIGENVIEFFTRIEMIIEANDEIVVGEPDRENRGGFPLGFRLSPGIYSIRLIVKGDPNNLNQWEILDLGSV